MEEDKVVLELGYGLISLVNKTNSGLITAISVLRKQKPCLPAIRIKDNFTLAPTEISINNERHLLENGNDSVSQIITYLSHYGEAHSEIFGTS